MNQSPSLLSPPRIRLRKPVVVTSPTTSPQQSCYPWVRDPAELASPTAWLYVSRRLDLEWLPNEPLWAAVSLTIGLATGPTAFYRLSPAVLVWLETAGEQLEGQWRAGKVERSQVDEYLAAMDTVWEFARVNLSGQAVSEQRGKPVGLPEPACPK
jgi:hypothetical protein